MSLPFGVEAIPNLVVPFVEETFGSLTLYYWDDGQLIIKIGEFERTNGPGVVLLEHNQGTPLWAPFTMAKAGRGMNTNCTDYGPAMFRGYIPPAGPGKVAGIRVRAQDTADMQPVSIEFHYKGAVFAGKIRGESRYVIEELPSGA